MPFSGVRDSYSPQNIQQAAGRFRKIVLWGLNQGWAGTHTHRHIFRAYYNTCQRLGLPVEWLSDKEINNDISADDLVFIHGTNQNLSSVLDSGAAIVDFHTDICQNLLGSLYERIKNYERRITELERRLPSDGTTLTWDLLTHYNKDHRLLSQPWGSDLEDTGFLHPVDSSFSDKVYWIGSWWHNNNENWGNYHELTAMNNWLNNKAMRLVIFGDCDELRNSMFIRMSRIAPAIGGTGQVEANYLACRLFKNISYGQFGISNIPRSQDILEGTAVYDADIPTLMDKSLSVTSKQANELTRFHQSKIRNYTVAAHLYIILLTILEYCPRRQM